jgi:muramoyltetrapeptide carboxypeptidase
MEQQVIWPKPLQKGDLIGIAAPARKVDATDLEPARELLHSWGFDTVLASNVGKSWGQLAGTDLARAEGVNALLREERVRAILTARGGYGSIRMVNHIDWDKLSSDPKWFVGFSDVTVLHAKINHMHMASIHGPVATTLASSSREAQTSLDQLLKGELTSQRFEGNVLRAGQWEGRLLGGNLSMLYSMQGTPLFPDLAGQTLLIEDLDEMLYHLDRMLLNFEHAGHWKRISGLLVGGLSDMRDNTRVHGFDTDNPFGREANEILRDAVSRFDFPVVCNLPVGHVQNNHSVVLGVETRFTAEDNVVEVRYG